VASSSFVVEVGVVALVPSSFEVEVDYIVVAEGKGVDIVVVLGVLVDSLVGIGLLVVLVLNLLNPFLYIIFKFF